MIDFVGYKAPASKARLVGLDFLLVGLQVVMMGLVIRRREMEIISRRDGGDGGGGGRVGSSAQHQHQHQQWRRGARDTDGEEPEVFTFSSSETEAEEEEHARDHLQPSSTSSVYTSARADYYTTDYLSTSSSSSSSSSSPLPPHHPHQLQDHPLDTLHSGQYIIANIHLGETLRKEWKRYRYPAAEPSIATIV